MSDETEQQLRAKIASQKAALAEFPSLQSIVDETGLTSPETKARAQQIKELSDNEEELELLLESRRVEAVISLQDELHPPENPEDCPICLETIKHLNCTTICRLYCCGGWICKQCFEERNANYVKEGSDNMLSNKCPLCRERLYTNYKEVGTLVLEHLNKGKAWAQFLIGSTCLDPTCAKEFGLSGLSFDEKKCWKLIEQAADQGDPHALFFISGYGDEVEINMQRLERAADLGYPEAQHDLASFLHNNMNDEEEKCLHYMTLASSQGCSKACCALGSMFMYNQYGLTRSCILAKHYAGQSLEETLSMYDFSIASFFLESQRHEGITEIPGHSPIPTFLFWGRRAVEGNLLVEMKDNLTKRISEVEEHVKSYCANCWKEAGSCSFKRCVRCLGAWYCGKECQVEHWKAGHKIDCVKRK